MAYAAVLSLKHTIQRLENRINKPQITNSAYEECDSLRSMLKELDKESSRSIDRRVVNELDAKIRDAAWKVEDILDPYQYSRIISTSQGDGEKSCSGIPLVDEITIEIDLFMKTVKMLRKEYNSVLKNPSLLSGEEEDEALSAAVPPVNKSTTVGLSDLSEKIINQLLQGKSRLKIVSLFGMAGIGKTHLATDIYHHPLIVQHFHSRVWVSVGPKYQINNILVDILSQIEGKPRDRFKEKSEITLRHLLRKCLHSTHRYLIVLDDVWSYQVFSFFKNLLPVFIIGSRVLLTTRLQEQAKYQYGSHSEMPFLNKEESWNLLWRNVFVGEKSFPYQLEKPGRKIAENCEGLPLLILTVANILRGLNKTEEYWEKVAKKKTTTFTDAYDQIYEVLLPSYEYLPQHLKPYFLYMGVFRQSCEIRSSKLIDLWAVEDFIEPSRHKKLERSAMKSMEDLVSKSLAIICKWSFERERRIKSSKLHSVYWYLCVTEARKNKLFHVLNKLTDVYIERPRRLAVHNNVLLGLKEVYDSMAAVTSTTRSLVCTGVDHQYPVRICFNMMLLMRVLDALAIRFYEFPNEILKLLQLRYLSLTHNGELPSSISNLQQLQCLILRRHHNIIKLVQRDSSCLPDEIWEMPELRHVRIMGSNLPDPSKGEKLPKLSTLYVNANSCTEHVFRSIPNLKKLGITIELQPDDAAETIRCLEHIRILDGLESLKCVVVNPQVSSQSVASLADDLFAGIGVPLSLLNGLWWNLKKLSLNGLGFSWNYMSVVGSLYCLEVLKLRCCAFQGPEWNTKAGQFKSLTYLLLEDIDLVHWTFQDFVYIKCFPRLRHLTVRHCYKLKKIPSEIGDIRYMQMMEVDDCSPSVVDSAQQIKVKTRYSHLQVVVNSSWNLR